MKPYDVVAYDYASDYHEYTGMFRYCDTRIANVAIKNTGKNDFLNVILFKLRNGQIIKVRKK